MRSKNKMLDIYCTRRHALLLLRNEYEQYELEPWHELSFVGEDRVVIHRYYMQLPQSHVEAIGRQRFYNFCLRSFQLMQRARDYNSDTVMFSLRHLVRKMKFELIMFYKKHVKQRKYTNQITLGWFESCLKNLLESLWFASQKEQYYLSLKNKRLNFWPDHI